MSYLYSKGKRVFGDIEFEDDTNTQIDFEDDYIGLVAGGSTILAASGSTVTFNEAYTFPAADGNNKQVLSTDGSGAVTWENIPGAGDSLRRTVSKPTSTFSADPASYSVFAVDCNTADVTATLPVPSGENEGFQVTFIKNAGGNTLTITAGNLNIWDQGTATTNYQITSHGGNVTLVCISYAWIVIAEA